MTVTRVVTRNVTTPGYRVEEEMQQVYLPADISGAAVVAPCVLPSGPAVDANPDPSSDYSDTDWAIDLYDRER